MLARQIHVAALAALCATCGGSKASEPANNGPSLASHMHKTLEVIEELRAAIVRGELGVAKERATKLIESLSVSGYPDDWGPHLQRVRAAATATARATNLLDAALHTARAGSACGRCHAAFGAVALSKESAPPPPTSEPVTDFMNQHKWSAERLWEGLVGPSDEAWSLAAKTLAETAPLSTDDMTAEMKAQVAALDEIADRSAIVSRVEEREEVYGELLGTCAACHTAYGTL